MSSSRTPEPIWRSAAFGVSEAPTMPFSIHRSARSRWKSRLIRSERTAGSLAPLKYAEARATSGAVTPTSGSGTGRSALAA